MDFTSLARSGGNAAAAIFGISVTHCEIKKTRKFLMRKISLQTAQNVIY
jgi:hypothetical protein